MDPNQSPMSPMGTSPESPDHNKTGEFSTRQAEEAMRDVHEMDLGLGPSEFRVERLNDDSKSQI
jgi:hypothetical protein